LDKKLSRLSARAQKRGKENALFQNTNEEFHVKIAQTPEEVKGLLKTGFEYVCEKYSSMFFRKRK